MNKALDRAGRIFFAVPFVFIGLGHFANARAMARMLPAMLPGAVLLVYFTGAIQILCSVAIVVRRGDRRAGLVLAGLLAAYVLLVHVPSMLAADGDAPRMVAMGNVLKDLGLAGGALILASSARASRELA
jgi:uncharacterized membrane protein